MSEIPQTLMRNKKKNIESLCDLNYLKLIEE